MKRSRLSLKFLIVVLILILVLPLASPAGAQDEIMGSQWCSGVHIRFFVGGAEGDAFASIVLRGAQAAERDLGPTVDYVFSGWDRERMTQQLREAVAAQPDGIAMMGHPGDAAIMPLAEEASAEGILMMYQNVDVPDVRARFGGGYVGADLYPQGRALGEEAIRQFGLQSGDTAIILGPFADPNRGLRERGTADVFEELGMNVVRIESTPEWATDPNLAIPVISAAILANPDVRLIGYPGGQMLGNAPTYMQSVDKQPGDIINIGFDTSPLIMEAFDEGWVHLTSDQQPFLQGYMPILSICQMKVLGTGPLNVDTGAGFVDSSNYQTVAALARAGLR
jgi:simple sugar transport system substrate-binding protein